MKASVTAAVAAATANAAADATPIRQHRRRRRL